MTSTTASMPTRTVILPTYCESMASALEPRDRLDQIPVFRRRSQATDTPSISAQIMIPSTSRKISVDSMLAEITTGVAKRFYGSCFKGFWQTAQEAGTGSRAS